MSELSYNTQEQESSNPMQEIDTIRDILLSAKATLSQDINNFVLKWHNITNAIQKELYWKMATEIWKIIQQNDIKKEAIYYTQKEEKEDERKKGLEYILEKVKKTMDVDINEIEFIRDIVKRAKAFKPQIIII